MEKEGYWSQSFTTDFARFNSRRTTVLSFRQGPARLDRARRSAFAMRSFRLHFSYCYWLLLLIFLKCLSGITGLPSCDFIPISISEFLSLICFLSQRGPCYGGTLIAYDGDNACVISLVKFRRPRKRISRFLTRILDRLECQYSLTAPPCFISSQNNVKCGKISRAHMNDPTSQLPELWGFQFVEVLSTSKWFLGVRL